MIYSHDPGIEGEAEDRAADDDAGMKDGSSSDAILRDCWYRLKCLLMEADRNLQAAWEILLRSLFCGQHLLRLFPFLFPFLCHCKVRLAVVNFHPDKVYGNRCGWHQVLLATAADKMNAFHKSSFWKSFSTICSIILILTP